AARLAAVGVNCTSLENLADALVLDRSTDVTALPGYAQGMFSVQDGAAQAAAGLLDLHDGMRVLDACAAPGGKSAQILEYANVDLLALDSDRQRIPRLQQNLDRLGLAADVRVGDASDPASWRGSDASSFDRILLDAPCSATGIIRRQPDIKLHRRVTDIAALVRGQQRLLDAMWPLLRPGGRMVYATCSILADENAGQITPFLKRHDDAHAVSTLPDWHTAGTGVQNLPGESGMDGFFYAVVEKVN
ncbi:MAG TPA: methyltransferase domain-containing protein, partial [Rudaea sp.]|nr:methyltransferase domain-containing protein [Rudaea sp.]